jgi:tetratricopeptide (TPR) repeat protein
VRLAFLICLTFAVVASAEADVRAQPAPEEAPDKTPEETPEESPEQQEARRLYAQGQTHYDLAEYEQAIDLFNEAYRLTRAPGLLYNLAQAHRLNGNCVEAERLYKSYVREDPEGKRRDKADMHLANVAACAEDQRRAQREAEEAKAVAEREAMLRASRPEPIGGPVDRPPNRAGRTKKLAGYTSAAIGLALGATGIYFHSKARQDAEQVDELYAEGGRWSESIDEIDQRGHRRGITAAVLYISGGAALSTGLVLYFLGRRDHNAAKQRLSVAPTAGGATVRWKWTW